MSKRHHGEIGECDDAAWRLARRAELLSCNICTASDADAVAGELAMATAHHCGGLPSSTKIVSLAWLQREATTPLACALDAKSPHSLLLVGWLKPLERHELIPGASRADVGMLVLTEEGCGSDGAALLPCSACANALPEPSMLGCLVLATSWAFLPACTSSSSNRGCGSDRTWTVSHLELTGPLLLLHPRRTSNTAKVPRSLPLDQVYRQLLDNQAAGKHRLLHISGQLRALSEPLGTREPIFYAELSSLVQPDWERASGREASDEVSGSSGDRGCAAIVAFVGRRAARWRAVLQIGRSYVLTNLRQDKQHDVVSRLRQVLRTSDDSCRETRKQSCVFLAASDELDAASVSARGEDKHEGHAASAHVTGRDAFPSQMEVLDHEALCTQSQFWGSHMAAVESDQRSQPPLPAARSVAAASVSAPCVRQNALHCTVADDEQPPPPGSPAVNAPLAASRPHQALINYVGEVTAHFGPHLLQLDGEWLLFLSLVATQLRLGLRVGAKVLVSAAHPLHVPTEELANTGQGNGWSLIGFGLCFRGSVSVLSHASHLPAAGRDDLQPPPRPIRPTERQHILDEQLSIVSRRLTLTELAGCFLRLLAAPSEHPLAAPTTWDARWEGVSPLSRANDALCRVLEAHGLRELRPATGPKLRGDAHGEFCCHAACCRLIEQRRPLPPMPPLAQALAALHALPLVREAMARMRTAPRPQLLLHEALRDEGLVLPVLIGNLEKEGEELAASPDESATLLLRDATAAIPLLLPPSEMRPNPLRGGLWAFSTYHLLIEPSYANPSQPPRLYLWTRLQSRVPWAPLGLPLREVVLPATATTTSSHARVVPEAAALTLQELQQQVTSRGVGTSRPSPPGDPRQVRSLSSNARHSVRCMLVETIYRDNDRDASLHLVLSDDDLAIQMDAYADLSRVIVPPGLLPRSGMLLHNVQARTSETTSKVYLALDATSTVTIYRHPAHDFDEVASAGGAAAAAVPTARGGAVDRHAAHLNGSDGSDGGAAAGVDGDVDVDRDGGGGGGGGRASVHASPRLSQAAVLNSHARPALLCELVRSTASTPHGSLRLLLTVRRVLHVTLALRCCACGEQREGARCRCPVTNASRARTTFEARALAEVTDGTGIARLEVKACTLVWALLHCSNATVAGVRAATERSGPLNCDAKDSGRYGACLVMQRGQWRSNGCALSDESKCALDRIWPSASQWNRELVATCNVRGRARGTAPQTPPVQRNITISGAKQPMLWPDEPPIMLDLLRLDHPLASVELERLLDSRGA